MASPRFLFSFFSRIISRPLNFVTETSSAFFYRRENLGENLDDRVKYISPRIEIRRDGGIDLDYVRGATLDLSYRQRIQRRDYKAPLMRGLMNPRHINTAAFNSPSFGNEPR